MAVTSGYPALASEYNTLASAVNRIFADNYAGSISFGSANQTYGWGGSSVPSVSAGLDLMLASQMNALIDRCNIGEDIAQGVSGTITPIVSETGILASKYNEIETKAGLLLSNRLIMEAAELGLTVNGSSIRSTIWSSAIDCTFRWTFGSFDEARYFFNTGGALNVYGSITGYSTGFGWDGEGFNSIFSNMGTISMDYTATTQSGSGGHISSIGYYDLTTSYQTIFAQEGTGSYYVDATLVLEARRSSSGDYVEFRVTLGPGAGKSTDGTTTITAQRRKLANQSSGGATLTVTNPVYTLQNAL